MRIAHFSDVHLSFTRYNRVTAENVNQREQDVADSFVRVVDGIIRERPDVVLCAGDLFDTVRPSNRAINLALAQFARFRDELPGVPVITVAGNHDSPRQSYLAVGTQGHILSALRRVGVYVAEWKAERFTFPGFSVLAVPESVCKSATLEPLADRAVNLLVIHAAIQGTIPGDGHLDAARLNAEQFDYVALGDYHRHCEVVPGAWYSGATDYTSSDVWREARAGEPHGFVIHDTETGAHRHVAHETRVHLDLAPVYSDGLRAEDIRAEIGARLDAIEGGIDGKVVRLVIEGIERAVQREVAYLPEVRKAKGRALNFQIDMRKPETFTVGGPMAASAEIIAREEAEQERQFQDWKAREFAEDAPMRADDYDDAVLSVKLCAGIEQYPGLFEERQFDTTSAEFFGEVRARLDARKGRQEVAA